MNSVWRHRVVVEVSACVIVLWVAASPSIAAVFGQNPFVNVINTPPVTITNNSTSGAGPASDKSQFATIFRAAPGTPLFYQEEWTTARNVETVFLDAVRNAGGNIFAATTSGGPVTTPVGSFSMPIGQQGTLVHIRQQGIFGVKVEVNATTDNNYQMGEIEFDSVYTSSNLAIGATSIASPGSLAGNMTDQLYNGQGTTEWRASSSAATNGGQQWTGWEYAPGVAKNVRGVRVVSASPHGATFAWNNWDLQIKQGGLWTTLGRANVPAGQNIHWVDFGTVMPIEGVRVFGSTAGGNNPNVNGGLIMDDIYAFLPEPGSAMLVAVAGVMMMKRRARKA